MSVKDDWKKTGKGIGKSVVGFGKAIAKTAKVGVDAAYDKTSGEEKNPAEKKDTGLRESWANFGHTFLDTGKSLGKAAAGTAKKVTDSLDRDEKAKADEKPSEEKPEDDKKD